MSDHSIPPDLQQVIVAEVLKTKKRYRERHRIYQARYRQRQSQAETKFKNAIIKLKLEIKDIQKKSKAPVRLATSPMSWELVSAYFWYLNNYVASPGTLYRNAFEFLHANVAPDVVDGSLFGIQAQIDNWRFLGYCFDDVRVELKGLKMLTSDILIAGTVTTVTFTAQTLRLMFPHLNSDGVGGRKGGVWSPLAAKTLFKKIVMSGSLIIGSQTLAPGSVIAADNVVRPGAPDFLEFIENNPQFSTERHTINCGRDGLLLPDLSIVTFLG
ncbi:hypothetical protein PInf_019155 [Phytophthora infestans]|nr:hypothetical protein PInf_019155 [Phytophthora infestans]